MKEMSTTILERPLQKGIVLLLFCLLSVSYAKGSVTWGAINAYQWQDSIILEYETLAESGNLEFGITPVPNFIFQPASIGFGAGTSTTTQTYRSAISLALLGGQSGTICFNLWSRNGGGWGSISDTNCVFITVTATPVWPGDANSDGVANVQDLLHIGIANGSTGPPRANANLTWTGQPAVAWQDSFQSHLNYKYSDCDGNGTINLTDTTAISLNYGLAHNKTTHITSNGIPLTLVYPDSVNSEDTVAVEVWLGSATTPTVDIYGLAFSLLYDSSQVEAGQLWFTPEVSFLGTPGSDMVSMYRDFHNDGQADFGLTRTDGFNRSGFGKVATINIVMVDNVSKLSAFDAKLRINPAFPWLLDNRGKPYAVSFLSTSNENQIPEPVSVVTVYPNPTTEALEIRTEFGRIEEVMLRDLTGTLQLHAPAIHTSGTRLELNELSQGYYFLEVHTTLGTSHHRILIQ